MAFRGWPAEALEFFAGLEADNSKTYWQANKAEYETIVLAPMKALLEELAPGWGEVRMFRPYRDVRFSKDKSPYRTDIAARIGEGYVSLGARGLAAGAGMWEMDAVGLDRYRRAVAADKSGKKLAAIVAKARSEGLEVMSRDELKTAPKGYPIDHPRIDLLRFKGIALWRDWPAGAWLGNGKSKDRVVEFFRSSTPLNRWLDANVK